HAYLADPALSGSAFKILLTEPTAWRWARPDNPLCERAESRPQRRGSAAHCAILEGLEAYDRRYCVAPDRADHPDALDTIDEHKAWLRERGLKLGGAKAELRARIEEAAGGDAPVFWEDLAGGDGGRTVLSAHDDAYVRLLECFVRRDRELAPLISGGLAEVTIVWRELGRRYKARLDYLGPRGVCDLKTYGREPKRGWSLRRHLVGEICANSYDLQAVHNVRAVVAAAELGLPVVASGQDVEQRAALVRRLLGEAAPPFHWLFLRMGGAPVGAALFFDGASDLWRQAEDDLRTAEENHARFDAAFQPHEFWMQSEGVMAIEEHDVPIWHLEAPR
ncbi:MAG: SAP domain-containing protein, partial [Planctomycetia bacterium]